VGADGALGMACPVQSHAPALSTTCRGARASWASSARFQCFVLSPSSPFRPRTGGCSGRARRCGGRLAAGQIAPSPKTSEVGVLGTNTRADTVQGCRACCRRTVSTRRRGRGMAVRRLAGPANREHRSRGGRRRRAPGEHAVPLPPAQPGLPFLRPVQLNPGFSWHPPDVPLDDPLAVRMSVRRDRGRPPSRTLFGCRAPAEDAATELAQEAGLSSALGRRRARRHERHWRAGQRTYDLDLRVANSPGNATCLF